MAYGDNRSSVASDTFDSSIGASWDNGTGDFITFAATGGFIQPSSAGGDFQAAIIRNTGTYANNQYSTATIQTLSAANFNAIGVGARSAGGASEAMYAIFWNSNNGGEGIPKYSLVEIDASMNFTTLAEGGTAGGASAGHTITIECEGTTIRGGTNEGSGDTQRLTTTDNTLASGRPAILAFAVSSAGNAQITSWVGGDITAGGGVAVPRNNLMLFGIG